MKLSVQIIGVENVYRKMVRTAAAASAAKPAMEQIVDEMMGIIKATFQSQGRRGGGSWRFLQPETVRRKIRMGQDPRIMFATHALFSSLTSRRDPNSQVRVTATEARVGTKLPYARVQNRTRPLIKLTRGDKTRMDKIIADHVVGHWRGRRSKL